MYYYIYNYIYIIDIPSFAGAPVGICQSEHGTFNTASFFLATRFACHGAAREVEAMGYLTVNQKQARGNHNIKHNMKVINSKINSVNRNIEFGRPRITTSSTGWGFDPLIYLIFAPADLETSSMWGRKNNYSIPMFKIMIQ